MTKIPFYLEPFADIVDFAGFGEFDDLVAFFRYVKKDDVLIAMSEAHGRLPTARKRLFDYDFVADSNLSGLGLSCAAIPCRMKRLSELAGFAVLYSDQVVARNPFDFARLQMKRNDAAVSKSEAIEVSFAIAATLALAPLVENGIITFSDVETVGICSSCYSTFLSELSAGRVFKNVERKADLLGTIYSSFLDGTEVRLSDSYGDNRYALLIEGEEELLEHRSMYNHISDSKGVLSSYKIGEKISRDHRIDLGVHRKTANLVFSDFVSRNVESERHGINRHLASSAEMSLVGAIFESKTLSNNFSPEFPFLASLKTDQLLKLRHQEWHHFEAFRKEIFDAADQVSKGERDVAGVMRDQVTPQMVDMQKVLERSRRTAGKDIINHSGLVGLSIASTVATSGISTLLSAVAGALGSGHFAAKMVPAVNRRLSEPDEILENEYYFSYKARKIMD